MLDGKSPSELGHILYKMQRNSVPSTKKLHENNRRKVKRFITKIP